MRQSLLILCLVMSGFLYSGCGSMPTAAQLETWKANTEKTLAAAANVAERAKAAADVAVAKASEIKAGVDAKLDAAKADLAAKGAPVDGSPAELTKWATQNPGTALSSLGGFLLVLAASVAKYRTAKKAATALLDGKAALSPEEAAKLAAAVAASPHMTPSVAAFSAAVENR